MENKVGDNLPSSADLEKIVKQLDGLIATLRKFCINLAPEERQVLTRGRRGAEEYLQQIADVAEQYRFSVPGATPSSLQNDLRTDRELSPIEQRLEEALALVKDTRRQASSEANEAGYMFYAIAQGAATRIPEIRVRIKPFEDFLATGPRRRNKKDPDPTE